MTMKRQKTLHRFAAVAAVLLTLCLVFMMPVSAEGTDGVIDTWEELKTALSTGEDVTLGGNIDVPSTYVSKTVGSGATEITGPIIDSGNVVTISDTVTLDLNGHSISAIDPNNAANSQWNYALFTVSGTLTITDLSDSKSGKITVTSQNDNGYNRASAVILVSGTGTVTINGGTLENTGGTSMAYAVSVQPSGGSATLNVNGGTVSSTKYTAVRGFANGGDSAKSVIAVNGGTVSGAKHGIHVHQWGMNNPSACDVIINDGTIVGGTGYAVYLNSDFNEKNPGDNNKYNPATLTINGGTLSTTSASAVIKVETDNSYPNQNSEDETEGFDASESFVKITAGDYSGLELDKLVSINDVGFESGKTPKLIINGGTFTDPTILNYLGEDAEVTVNLADGIQNLGQITIENGGKASLNLNGHDITFADSVTSKAIYVTHGKLDVIGKGTINAPKLSSGSSVIYLRGSSNDVSDYSVVSIGKDVIIKSTGFGIGVSKNSAAEDGSSYGVVVTIAGTIETPYCFTINGGVNKKDGNVPKIKVTETGKLTASNGAAIYAAGYGIWEIADGAQLSGSEALSIKSGKFTIEGGTFTANGAYKDPANANNNGSEDTGAALSITSNDGYADKIEVTINGGEFISQNGHAVYEGIGLVACTTQNCAHTNCVNKDGNYFVKGNDENPKQASDDSHLKSISITNGKFKSASGKDVILLTTATEKKNFVGAGLFSSEVEADYIAADKFSVKNLDSETKATYPYAVGDKKYAFSVDNAEIGFDSVKVGYTQPAAKEVTITNEGNTPFTLKATENDAYVITIPSDAELEYGEYAKISIQPKEGLAVGNYADTLKIKTNVEGLTADIAVSFLVYQPSSGGSSKPVEEPEEPVVEPEVPTEEPEAGEATVETEVTDGGEVEFEAPVEEPEAGEGDTPAAEDEAKITGVVLPTGTEGKVEFVPVSEQAAPAGKETQTKKVFEINVPTYEKGKPATIKFTMTVAELAADGKEAADVALWHFDEETGEWTKLVTSYTIVDGVVYFEAITNDFSPFAIVYEDEPANEPVDEPETPASPAPVLAVLAGLGAAVVLRRK